MRFRTLLLAGALAGCGGTAAKYTVDDVSLAQIPLAEKQPIFAAQNEVTVARSEQAKAEADLRQIGDDITIAGKEREQARLEKEKAKIERELAEKSKDMTRIEQADKALKTADLGERAADAKVALLEGRKKYQKRLGDVAEAHLGLANAKVELEKARLAQAKNIKPSKDFDPAKFLSFYNDKEKEMDSVQREANEAKSEMDKREQAWRDLSTQYAQARGQQPSGTPMVIPAPPPGPTQPLLAPAPMAPTQPSAPAPATSPSPIR